MAGGSYSVSISSAVIGVREAVGFAASRSSPCLASPLGINRLVVDVRPQIPASPFALPGDGSAERRDGSYLPQSPQICGFPLLAWQLADSPALRSSPNVWDDRSGLSDVFARRAFRPTDWHNCFGPWVLTGDLVLADNRRFPLFLHARAVALSMPEPSLGAPVPSRSLLFGVELFDRFARLSASVSRLARLAPPPAGSSSLDVTASRSASSLRVIPVDPAECRNSSGNSRAVATPLAACGQGDDLEESFSGDQPRPLTRESHVDLGR